jgi:phage baseplate assembly protein W
MRVMGVMGSELWGQKRVMQRVMGSSLDRLLKNSSKKTVQISLAK